MLPAQLCASGVLLRISCTDEETCIVLEYWKAVLTEAWRISGVCDRGEKSSERMKYYVRAPCRFSLDMLYMVFKSRKYIPESPY